MNIPTAHIVLLPSDCTPEFLSFLESQGVPDPSDDLDLIFITSADRLALEVNEDGSPLYSDRLNPFDGLVDSVQELRVKDCDELKTIVFCLETNDAEWYIVRFAEGYRGVGVFRH